MFSPTTEPEKLPTNTYKNTNNPNISGFTIGKDSYEYFTFLEDFPEINNQLNAVERDSLKSAFHTFDEQLN